MSVKKFDITDEAEKKILYIARVSSDQSRTDVGLIRFCVRMNHWSPFMHVYASMEIVTSRFISHEMIRHWSMACTDEGDSPAIQEFSQRYAEAPGTVKYRGRMKGASNRQSSLDTASEYDQTWYQEGQRAVEQFTLGYYREALRRGFATESARVFLLEATETKVYLSGSIRSWIHYLRLRCAEDAQLEHRILAEQMRDILAKELPTIAEVEGW